MVTIQEQLETLRIVQLETQVIFYLTFKTGAVQAFACAPENFTMDLGLKPKDVEKLLKDNQKQEE